VKRIASVLILLFSVSCFITPDAYGTALDDYVNMPDSNFSFSQYSSSPDFWTNAYTLQMTSQAWRDGSEVNPVLWTHWITIIVPKLDWLLGQTKDTALILINGGNVGDTAPLINDQFRDLATGTRSVIVELTCVPNQPLQFSDEILPRSEDEIIAYSWDKYLRGGDSYWPAQLPMVKSVVRCMDTVQTFVENTSGKTINSFVLTGGSKRGWTAWLTAAVDLRVTAIAPIVSDLLNMKRSFAHHWAAYGFWADALLPYEEIGIFDWFDAPEVDGLLEIVDPYEYLDRLTMPKFIINAAGDDFFVMDSIRFYMDYLQGETYIRHVPNTDHYLTGAEDDVFTSMVPYYDALLNNAPRPEFTWDLREDGSIQILTTDSPQAVNLWQASNTQTRDFRLSTTGPIWQSTVLEESQPGVYIAQVPVPPAGWTAFFVELIFDGRTLGTTVYDYKFTTEMHVLPEIRPFEADFTHDRQTDYNDLLIMAEYWLSDAPYDDMVPRRNGDGIINLKDFSVFAMHWLEGL
jgi:PhoPQ-activated pathogenicity-related protein